MVRSLALLVGLLMLAAACGAPQTYHMDGRYRTASDLADLVSRSQVVIVGTVVGASRSYKVTAGLFEVTYEDYEIETAESVRGDAPSRLAVTVAKSLRPANDPAATPVQLETYRPLTVGSRYVFFLDERSPTGQWLPAPEPWLFRVTDKVRAESGWRSADISFPARTLAEFLAQIKSSRP